MFNRVRELNISANNLKELPSWIWVFPNLETLNLESNPIKTLPVEIGNLKNLRTLKLAGTNISILPTQISWVWIEKLTINKLNSANEYLRHIIKDIEEVIVYDPTGSWG